MEMHENYAVKSIVWLSILFFPACSPSNRFQHDKPAFEASGIKKQFTSIANMNDAYFEIRENNFFELYRMLFDSVKNSSYPGKYRQSGDTLFLDFYSKKGRSLLGSRAVIDSAAGKINFFK